MSKTTTKNVSKKTVEEKYQKLSQREHVLQRPGMYIGSVKKQIEELWCFKDGKMQKAMVEFSPGFIKIFDEILTNALDHSARDSTLNSIKVDFNKSTGEISVWNNGSGVPIVEHSEHKMYIPELIFGHLLSGSNYDDSEARTGAGTNGIGSKATNVYSKKFIVETVDSENNKKFVQEYFDNMSKRNPPKITKSSVKSYTKITFIPDYARFDMKGLEDDTIYLLNKRVYDCIANTGNHVSVYLNGEKLKGKGLNDYIKYFVEDEKIIYDSFTQGEFIWEYAVVPSEHYEQVSFVNGNETRNGGKHVDYILYQIISKIKTQLETKKKLKDVKPNFIKDKIFLFLRATVVNPSFNSQTKEQLTTPSKDFGVSITVSDKFIEKIYKSPIVEDIVEFCKLKENSELAKKTDGTKKSKIYGIPKLEDALWAGTSKSDQCTLILTEGLSAMTFALWGRSVLGPDKIGTYPLKGKCNSADTKIPLWNGEIKLAKDIEIGDEVIGDDGNKRTVLNIFKGNGKMYEISQDRGESYKVNDEHVLTLCMPEHKNIFWLPSNYAWKTIYWDKDAKNIKAKKINASIKINCKECGVTISTNSLKRHYKRKHKNIKYTPYKLEDKDMNDLNVIQARKMLEEFLLGIDDNNIIDISIGDYLNVTESFKRKLKGLRGECVNWEYKHVELDPYVLGLWLGDGSSNGYGFACNGKLDSEIINYLNTWGKKNDAIFKAVQSSKYSYSISSIDNFRKMGNAPLKKMLSMYNLIQNKHIPRDYLINSKEIRLKLLAGIIDTDGYVSPLDGTIEISQSTKHKQLIDDIVYLSRSLGFYTYLRKKTTNYKYVKTGEFAEAYIIKISGDTAQIPTILPRKKSISTSQYIMRNSTGTIQIKEINNEDYVGITIDGNNRFLINDFTVTHNCLNVRDATTSQLLNNEELNNIKQILGLKQNVEYKDTKSLRYGRVMCLTDADVDGSHIRGLFINFIHATYPSLIKLNFVQTMKTPIVKAIKGKQVIEFFNEQDYRAWKENVPNIKSYHIKYFKGLGTSKKEDAQDLFKRLNNLQVNYYYKDKKCDDAILLAFEKDKNLKDQEVSCTDQRKEWLSHYDKNSYIDLKETKTSYQDFIHKELIHFSIYDNLRSIPSVCDGLKPSQRKILYYMLKNNVTSDIKVAQLSGYISAEMSYHHGEASLQGAIINMAQDFVGSNNINMLIPEGNFGSRLNIGKDAASPRYIFTRLNTITNQIYNSLDNPLYTYLNDDGMEIEPEYMLPIIPMILVNGCEGIGTGYSTYIPQYNPKDIIQNLLNILQDKPYIPLFPYFRNFNGDVVSNNESNTQFMTMGKWKKISNTKIEITELPIGTGVIPYKEFLETFIETGSAKTQVKKKFYLKDVENKTKDENTQICFMVEFKNEKDLTTLIETNTLMKELKLTKTFTINNMYLFNPQLILTKYATPYDILMEFYNIRLTFYEKRRLYMIEKIEHELSILKSKIRFIDEYINNVLDINKKSKAYTIELLEKRKYCKMNDSYDYLINMPIVSFTSDKITELTMQHDKKQKELNHYKINTDKQLWIQDLTALLKFI